MSRLSKYHSTLGQLCAACFVSMKIQPHFRKETIWRSNQTKNLINIEKDRKSVKTEDLVIDVKQEEYEDEQIKFQYNIKEREWCVRMFKRCRNSPEWYKAFQYEFKKQFHHVLHCQDESGPMRMALMTERATKTSTNKYIYSSPLLSKTHHVLHPLIVELC